MNEWRESVEALSEEDREVVDKQYYAFVEMYNKNTEVLLKQDGVCFNYT
jgi:hypothetical protein